jgi:hypothetical protein
MARPRKTLQELKLTGTYQQNKSRYADRVPVPAPKVAAHGTDDLSPPSHLKAAAKKAWLEVVAMFPLGTLGQTDRLMVEIASQLLVKQRAGTIKVAELKQLTTILTGFQSPSRAVTPAPSNEPEPELTPEEKFFRDDDEDKRRDIVIREEINRRKEVGPLPGQTEKDFEYYCRWNEVETDLTKQHGWYRLYVD